MKKTFTALAAFISAILLASLTTACIAPTLDPNISPASTALPSPKDVDSKIPLESPVFTPTPTATRAQTNTPTLEPVVELSPTPDWETIATQIAALPDSETWAEPSPDGKWTAVGRTKTETGIILGEQELYYTQLKVVSTDQSVEWTLVEEISPFGLGYTTPEPLHWSADGRYLYYTNQPHVDGCGLFVNASDLWRVDLADGSITQALPEGAKSYAFSPDDSQVAYVTWSTPPDLVLHDLGTGEDRRLGLDFEDAGALVWSPDGIMLALTGAENPCQAGWAHTIVVVDTSDLTPRTLNLPDERLLNTNDWQEAGKILLEDFDRNLWWLDVESGDVTLIE